MLLIFKGKLEYCRHTAFYGMGRMGTIRGQARQTGRAKGLDGTGRDGTGRDGTGRDGTGRNGTGQNGTGQNGTGRTGRDGTY